MKKIGRGRVILNTHLVFVWPSNLASVQSKKKVPYQEL